MHAVVSDVAAVQAALVSEELIQLPLHVVLRLLPAAARESGRQKEGRRRRGERVRTDLCVLSTASPKPGVSTMLSLSLTPFSSMLTVRLVVLTV